MTLIQRTARADIAPDTYINSNVHATIRNIKHTDTLPSDGKGERRRYTVEVEGLGTIETEVDLPASLVAMKDDEKREARTKSRVLAAAKDEIDALHAAHVN